MTTVFGDHGVSIRSMEQEGGAGRGAAARVFVTHLAREGDVRATLAAPRRARRGRSGSAACMRIVGRRR